MDVQLKHTFTYFIRGSISAWMVSTLTGLDLLNKTLRFYLQTTIKLLNTNQSKWRLAIQ